MQVLHTVLFTFPDTYKENLSNNQEPPDFAIISFLLMTLIFDSGVYCWEKLDAYRSKGSNDPTSFTVLIINVLE